MGAKRLVLRMSKCESPYDPASTEQNRCDEQARSTQLKLSHLRKFDRPYTTCALLKTTARARGVPRRLLPATIEPELSSRS